jgi:CPA2 family monovalent cation:H+ antiporter-2
LTGAGLFQIGEFGFILAQSGINMGIISDSFYSIIVSSAIITMLLTPLFLSMVSRIYPKIMRRKIYAKPSMKEASASIEPVQREVPGRVVIAGYGRVGQNIAQGLQDAGIPYIIIDIDPERISEARSSGRPRVYGDATNMRVLNQANLVNARALVITYPDPMAVVTTAKVALNINHGLKILARVHREKEVALLKEIGVTELISPEYEASFRFIKRLLNITGLMKEDRKQILEFIRKDKEIAEFNPDQSV